MKQWIMLGVTCGDASDLTTEVYLQSGRPLNIGEKVEVVDKSELEAAVKMIRTLEYALREGDQYDKSQAFVDLSEWRKRG